MKSKHILFLKIYILVVLLINSPFIRVNAKDTRITTDSLNIKDARTETINGTIYLPLRNIFQSLGWKVYWSSKEKSVKCVCDNGEINFKLGSKEIYIDKTYSLMDSPFIIIKNKSYIPKKFITQQFGIKARWNKKGNIIITSDKDTTSVTVNGGNNIVIVGDGIIVNIFEPCNVDTINDMISYSDRLLAFNNPEEAIKKYNEILDNISKDETPDVYAHVMNNMANAYSKLSEYKQTKRNISIAIKYYHEAIAYYKDIEDTANYSILLNNLGSAYRVLCNITGNNSLLKTSIDLYRESLKFYTLTKYPMDYSLIQYNMAKAYSDMDNFDLSIDCLLEAKEIFTKVLEKYTIDKSPSCYALIQYNLGSINFMLKGIYPLKGSTDNLSNYFNEALKVWTAESYPMNYAKVHQYLGYMNMKSYENSDIKEYLYTAKEEYNEASKFYSLDRSPYKYAEINYDLGYVEFLIAKLNNNEDSILNTICCYQNCLKVFNIDEYPKHHKSTLSAIEKLNNIKEDVK
ncbi:stalk domain-containing protein [Pseudobacteroides cellulosolvens]|uniref:Copper amine oxidase-like domain-containing protein n=1 Tax=Pseudobacteroides cellulosolvens ATCC 35603 = DSM 2933 TaxID=398512 RepID=A0A0L6JVJ7_9FIRM|nr:stalk domain-containing protein [Pseudobacteroides cellulosolvens]KNY29729.1 copper amine oxidase-like domain-containing protein [Pseudobacteroides cellulosolvens ATCC 35603 = DSM 2933]